MEIKLAKYEKYKNSGVEWLGEIPEHWEVKKITYLFSKIGSGTTPTAGSSVYYENGTINFLQTGDLNDGYITETLKKVTKKALTDNSSLKIFPKESLVIAMYGATIGKLGLLKIETTTNQACCVLGNSNKDLNIKFIFYCFSFAKVQIISMSYGGGQPNISQDLIKSLRIQFPPLKEQTAIAKFLDDKTQKIDQAIRVKQEQIVLLKERRQVLIHQAITRGLDKAVKLKDSGVEWIGEIPEHWEVKRFRDNFKLSKGLTITKENLIDEGIFCVNYGEIHSKYGFEVNPSIHKLKCVGKEYLNKNAGSILQKGDFVFADTSEDILGSGNFTYLNSDEVTFAGYHTVIARPSEVIDSRFVAYEFDSIQFRNQIRTKVKGVKVYSITQSILKELFLWLPPKNEQKEIAKHLDNETSKISNAVSLKEKEIEKLKEYKASLINSVVTGKVRVS